MSNIHQLVKELATLEQRRKELEEDLNLVETEFEAKLADAKRSDTELSEEIYDIYWDRVDDLEEQLDNVYNRIDEVQADIDEEGSSFHSHYDDE